MKNKDSFPILDINHLEGYSKPNVSLIRHEAQWQHSISKPHKHTFYHLLIVERGSGSHTIDFKSYPVHDYTIFFLAPGQVHQWELTPQTRGVQLMFTPTFLNELHLAHPWPFFANAPFCTLDPEQFHNLTSELLQIELELQQQDTFSETILLHRLWLVLSLLERWYRLQHGLSPSQQSSPLIDKLTALVEAHFLEHTSVQFYADSLHTSTNYLNKLCRHELSVSVGEYIRQRLLLEAKRLLATTTLSVKEIASYLGYKDAAYFTRYFSKEAGVSPALFRENSREVQDMA